MVEISVADLRVSVPTRWVGSQELQQDFVIDAGISRVDDAQRWTIFFGHGPTSSVQTGNDVRWNAEYQIQLHQYGRGRLTGCELLPTRYERSRPHSAVMGNWSRMPRRWRPRRNVP
jgi:hypothetical protein